MNFFQNISEEIPKRGRPKAASPSLTGLHQELRARGILTKQLAQDLNRSSPNISAKMRGLLPLRKTEIVYLTHLLKSVDHLVEQVRVGNRLYYIARRLFPREGRCSDRISKTYSP